MSDRGICRNPPLPCSGLSSLECNAVRTSIGRYRVERVLGEGGMGVVYGAHDDQLGRRVAIKTIREETGDSTSRDRLWREARAAASVNHPNICHVYEVGTEQEAIYLVMEWLDGEPLSARVSRGPIPVSEALPIAHGMLAALEALHDRRIGDDLRERLASGARLESREIIATGLTNAIVNRGGPVLVSFFGNLGLGQVAAREHAQGMALHVASLLDLAGTKVAVIQKRAEVKDYLDVDALLRHGLDLATALATGAVVYGRSFNPLITLKALSYFDDVPTLAADVRKRLMAAVAEVDVTNLPVLTPYAKRPDDTGLTP